MSNAYHCLYSSSTYEIATKRPNDYLNQLTRVKNRVIKVRKGSFKNLKRHLSESIGKKRHENSSVVNIETTENHSDLRL